MGDLTTFCALWDNTTTTMMMTMMNTAPAGNNATVRILQQTILHKPAHPVEWAQIEQAHGQVLVPLAEDLKAGASSQVIIPQHYQQPQPSASSSSSSSQQSPEGPVISTMALAMSRSLGDEE